MRSHKLLFLLPFFFFACQKEEIGPQYTDERNGGRVVSGEKVLYVVNEGNFQSGNASLTRILPESGEVTQRVYEGWTGRSLGDVAQFMTRFDGNFFITVNNSGTVEGVSAGPDREDLGTIGGMDSPREFLGLNPHKAYVTDLYADAVHIVDPSSMEHTGSIATDGWTEAILEYDGEVFVTNMDQGQLDRIDPAEDAIVDSLELTEQPNSMVRDGNGKIWVLCDGGFEEELPALYRIDPKAFEIEKKFEFPDISRSPSDLTLSPDQNRIYYLDGGVRRMGVQEEALPQSTLIEEGNGTFYNLAVLGKEEWILLTDAKDYVQKGALYRYRTNGTPIDTFETGIIPNDVHYELE